MNGQQGMFHVDYERRYLFLNRVDDILGRIQTTKQINAEAKGCIERIEKEVREKYSH